MSAVLDEETARALLKHGKAYKTKRIKAVQLVSDTVLDDGGLIAEGSEVTYPAGSYLCDANNTISIMSEADFEIGFTSARAVKPKPDVNTKSNAHVIDKKSS